jgi:hypothetical protein
MIKSLRFLLPVLIALSCLSVNTQAQNYSTSYFKKKATNVVKVAMLDQRSNVNGVYVRIARELMGSDFVITNAAGVMVLMGTFNNDSFTFDSELFTGARKQDYFLSLFRDNKQLASEKLML